MEDFAESTTSLVADVDCTAEGESLCSKHGVQGYPTIKYGNPDALQDYDGERSYDGLKKFADENLGPSCGPSSLELCSDEKKAQIEKFMKMSEGKLDAKIRKAEAALQKLEDEAEELTKGLQESYEEGTKKKEKTQEEIKAKDFGLMKSVLAYRTKSEKSEL
eukprot:TRINITY_DN678_c0_g3_i1.p1 TRINITY_DN678_c0_g3~~TRINITY_DN678_c0_g3_i1.p1  ORF type:complete len:162 (-),score=55.80 TRINITY_DN678_c0_g3_i1:50-535(-)